VAGGIIAFSGKGGAGKTTLAAMVLRQLVRMGHRPVLAVDADANATFAAALGIEAPGTIADLRDRMGQAAKKISEIPKQRLMDQWLSEMLYEAVGFDLLAMGRPEGPQCYCYVNSLLRRYLKELRDGYAAVVMDCEAGMEYLSRLTVDDVETLVLVAEPTLVGLRSAARIEELADALPIRVHRRVLALNKLGRDGLDEAMPEGAPAITVDATIRIPFDQDIYQRCVRGEAIDDEAGPASRAAVEKLAELCLSRNYEPAPAVKKKELPT